MLPISPTPDPARYSAHLRWDDGEGVKVSRKVMGWDIDGLKSKEEEENYKNAQKIW